MANVQRIIRSESIPTISANSGSFATARNERPVLVWCMASHNRVKSTIAEPTVQIWIAVTRASPIGRPLLMTPLLIDFTSSPNVNDTTFCAATIRPSEARRRPREEAPFRRMRLYTANSIRTPKPADPTIAITAATGRGNRSAVISANVIYAPRV